MELLIASTTEELAGFAADRILDALDGSATHVLGVATGSSPLGVYAELARRKVSGSTSFGSTSVVALDEYVGLSAHDPSSYMAYVRNQIVRPLGIERTRVHVPLSLAVDPHAEAIHFEERILELGGVDVQVVGIGSNGHLGFNEPGSSFESVTRVVELSESTRKDNARHFETGDSVPAKAITQGLATIARARRIILVAQGGCKAESVAAALYGPVSVDCPASILQLHPEVTVVIDREAARLLTDSATLGSIPQRPKVSDQGASVRH